MDISILVSVILCFCLMHPFLFDTKLWSKLSFIPAKEGPPSLPGVHALDYFYWDQSLGKKILKIVCIRSWTKEKNKIWLQYLYKWPGTEKESNQTISPKNKSCRRKTREVYQNAVWLMFLHKNSSLYVFFSLL